MSAITVENLSVRLGGAEILKGISAEFHYGELAAVVGPNGAGKSTWLRAIFGIVESQGQVRIDDRQRQDLSPKELAQAAALVPQETFGGFDFTVEQVVAMARYPHLHPLEPLRARDHEIVRGALSRLELRELANRQVATLSGGERQRVFLARALATESKILFGDEPFAHLDIGHRLDALDIFRSLVDSGFAVVLVLHDLNLALRYADRVFFIDNGKLVRHGAPKDVLESPELQSAFGVDIDITGDHLQFGKRR